MNKVNLGYHTLKEAAELWGCTDYKILEWGANGLLEIYEISTLRRSRIPDKIGPSSDSLLPKGIMYAPSKIGPLIGPMVPVKIHPKKDYSPRPVHPYKLNEMLIKWMKPLCSMPMATNELAITEEELNRFEQEQGFQIHTEEDYPRELKIAVELWNKVFARGLTPQDPPLSMHDMVKRELEPYRLEDPTIKRICYIIIAEKSRSKVIEPTTTEHTRNEQGHPHHAPLFEIAVKLWEACKGLDPYKEGAKQWLGLFHKDLTANKIDGILELTNPKPKGGRPKDGA